MYYCIIRVMEIPFLLIMFVYIMDLFFRLDRRMNCYGDKCDKRR